MFLCFLSGKLDNIFNKQGTFSLTYKNYFQKQILNSKIFLFKKISFEKKNESVSQNESV